MFEELVWRQVCLSARSHYQSQCRMFCAVAEMGDRLATRDMGRKVGTAAVPLSVGGAGSPSKTMWPGPKPTSVPSDILIHPTVWPQYTNLQTDRQDRQANGSIPQGEPLVVTIA